MSFAHECNKNNIYDTKRDIFTRYSRLLSIRLRFINLFVVINGITKIESANPCTLFKKNNRVGFRFMFSENVVLVSNCETEDSMNIAEYKWLIHVSFMDHDSFPST